MVFPPITEPFSISMTFAPVWAALSAALKPAPPAPITRISEFQVCGALGATLASFALSAATSKPAFLAASATAFLIPLLASVAPVTVSTFRLCVSTMRAGMRVKATFVTMGVSFAETIPIEAIRAPATTTLTLIGPCIPYPVPSYVPSTGDGTFAASEAQPAISSAIAAMAIILMNVFFIEPPKV